MNFDAEGVIEAIVDTGSSVTCVSEDKSGCIMAKFSVANLMKYNAKGRKGPRIKSQILLRVKVQNGHVALKVMIVKVLVTITILGAD